MLVKFIDKIKKKNKQEKAIYTFFLAFVATLVFIFSNFFTSYINFDKYLLFTTTYKQNYNVIETQIIEDKNNTNIIDDIFNTYSNLMDSVNNIKKDEIIYNLTSDITVNTNNINKEASNISKDIKQNGDVYYDIEQIRRETGKIDDTNKKIKMNIAGIDFDVYLATNIQEQSLGLSHSDQLCQSCAMLFVFETPRVLSFWMRDMKYNIDIIFIDENGKIITIYENVSPKSYQDGLVYESIEPAKYVLETNAGMARNIGLKADNVLYLDKSLKDLQ